MIMINRSKLESLLGLVIVWCAIAFFVKSVINDVKQHHIDQRQGSLVTNQIKKKIMYDTIEIDRVTTYNPVASQCDSNPLTTADGSKINLTKLKNEDIRWCALSRDLISRWNGPFDYGDTLNIISDKKPWINGQWIVHDCMNARYTKSMDLLFDKTNNKPKLGIAKDVKILIKK